MGNKATQQPRSFNTIRRSQTKVRAKRRMTQRIVLLAMFATVALILISLLVLGGFAIANAIIDKPTEPSNGDNDTPPANKIEFHQITNPSASIHEGPLVLVNLTNEYLFPESAKKNLVRIHDHIVKADDGRFPYKLVQQNYKLQISAVDALNAMMLKNYEVTGDVIIVTDAYRSYSDQEGKSTPAGFSDHHTGYCFPIRYASDNSHLEADHWIYENCHKYGFVVRYPAGKESWTGIDDYTYCLRYVGIPHATYMTQNDLCMEEYLDLLQNNYNSSAKRLSIAAADGISYEVYYVPASNEELTTLDVPSNYTYTISGDNRSGFIVTVTMTAPAA